MVFESIGTQDKIRQLQLEARIDGRSKQWLNHNHDWLDILDDGKALKVHRHVFASVPRSKSVDQHRLVRVHGAPQSDTMIVESTLVTDLLDVRVFHRQSTQRMESSFLLSGCEAFGACIHLRDSRAKHREGGDMHLILGTQEEFMSDSQTNRRLSQLTVSEEENFDFFAFVHLDCNECDEIERNKRDVTN